ncbi:MAG: cation:proton antiporter [Desulfobacteraceae bacterium]
MPFKVKRHLGLVALLLLWFLVNPEAAAAAAETADEHALLNSIGISILVATVLAFLASLIKQPLILAYIAAGAAIGPQFGFGWVASRADIQIISEIGLILLLFMIGLELNLKKLKESGKSLITTGVLQFILCAALGGGFFLLLGFTIGASHEYQIFGVTVQGGEYDLLYLAVCLGLSSTTIVVKLLYEKFELDTLAGRLTLGVLIFQDLWAIVILSLQPNLANPQMLGILLSFAEAALLVLTSLLLSKYLLGYIFKKIAKLPELVLVASLGWCFFICGLADFLGLSREMGALIAGMAISTFPYNLDIIAKIVSIRDFFITLFFVALGMAIPNPLHNLGFLLVAGATALFLVATRFLTVFPLLYFLKNGSRVSLLTSINLSQISEFALVISVLGLKYQHIAPDIQTIIIFVFVITSISSTYMIKYNQRLQEFFSRLIKKVGFKDLGDTVAEEVTEAEKEIALLGFFRVASDFLAEIEASGLEIKDRMVVVDFNPQVFRRLKRRGVKVIYGDISSLSTLHHAGIEGVKVVVSTIPDELLVGTSNLKIIKQMKTLAPHAKFIVTAKSAKQALKLYQAGADYVLLPHQVAARNLIPIVDLMLHGRQVLLKEEEMEKLRQRQEVLD